MARRLHRQRRRPVSADLFQLIRKARASACAWHDPAATSLLTQELSRAEGPGLDQMAVSLDFPTRSCTTRSRRGGAFAAPAGIEWAHRCSCHCRSTRHLCRSCLPARDGRTRGTAGIVFWSVLLVPVGAARNSRLEPEQCEQAFESSTSAEEQHFVVKITEGSTTAATCGTRAGGAQRPTADRTAMPTILTRSEGPATRRLARAASTRNGFLFVSHTAKSSERLPARSAGTSAPRAWRTFTRLRIVPDAAGPGQVARPLRGLRVPRDLRRFAFARLPLTDITWHGSLCSYEPRLRPGPERPGPSTVRHAGWRAIPVPQRACCHRRRDRAGSRDDARPATQATLDSGNRREATAPTPIVAARAGAKPGGRTGRRRIALVGNPNVGKSVCSTRSPNLRHGEQLPGTTWRWPGAARSSGSRDHRHAGVNS